MRRTWAWAWLVGTVLAAGCCTHPAHGDAVRDAAADNAAAGGLAMEYVRDWGRAESPAAVAERERTLSRCVAWGTQADAIVAGLARDKSYDAAQAYARWAVRATETTSSAAEGAAGPGPAPAPPGAAEDGR